MPTRDVGTDDNHQQIPFVARWHRKFRVYSEEEIVYPVCARTLVVIGTRQRKFIDSNRAKQPLIIRRLRCKVCHTIHHELPDIVIPYKRHCADTVEKIIAGSLDGLFCEDSTIRRIKAWWVACRLYFESVMASLRKKYAAAFPQNPAPREIVRAVANAHLWNHTRSAFLSG